MSCCTSSDVVRAAVSKPRALKLEFLFLDETVCKPCGGTRDALEEALGIVAAPLAAIGTTIEVEKIHVATRQDAIAHRLVMSPTLRINGVDIDPEQTQGECGSCGNIAGGRTTVNCRTWEWNGETHSSAPTGKIVEAILAAATRGAATPCCGDAPAEVDYELPKNLEGFFDARDHGEHVCC